MLTFLFFIGSYIARYTLIVALYLTYVRYGAGGEALGLFLDTVIDQLGLIDWELLGEKFILTIKNIGESIFNELKNIDFSNKDQ